MLLDEPILLVTGCIVLLALGLGVAQAVRSWWMGPTWRRLDRIAAALERASRRSP